MILCICNNIREQDVKSKPELAKLLGDEFEAYRTDCIYYRDTKKNRNFSAYDWQEMSFYRCSSCNGKRYTQGSEKIPFMARHDAPDTGRKYVYFEKPSGICKFCGDKKVLE